MAVSREVVGQLATERATPTGEHDLHEQIVRAKRRPAVYRAFRCALLDLTRTAATREPPRQGEPDDDRDHSEQSAARRVATGRVTEVVR